MLKSMPSVLLDRLSRHIRDYSWINTDDIFGRPWNELDLIARLKHLVREDCKRRLDLAIDRQTKREEEYQRLIRDMRFDKDFLQLVEISRVNSHLRTHRTEVYVKAFHQFSSLATEIAGRVGLRYGDALYCSIDELEEAIELHRPIAESIIADRRDGMAYIMVDRRVRQFFGQEAIRLALTAGLQEDKPVGLQQITGTIANMGLVRGYAKIVHDISELGKVREGDILVASMTIPEFVPAMEKAEAFITDEGGITCHAAILSREMNVPCIIGTEIATRVLRDGDFVEVDANKGIVRILA